MELFLLVENFHDVKIQPHHFLIYERNDEFTTPTGKSTAQNNIDETSCKSEGKQCENIYDSQEF